MKNKKIDASRYSKIEINSGFTETRLMDEGIIFAPYIPLMRSANEVNVEYDEFMVNYCRLHEYCPKCGSTAHTRTLMGYILNMDKKEEYKDLNVCECSECGNVHTVHDRKHKCCE